MIRFTIPRRLLSANQLLRMHWAKRRKEQCTWDLELLASVDWMPPLVPVVAADGRVIGGRRRVRIIRYGPKLLDTDNLYAGVKMLLDSCKNTGLIHDDSPQWCRLTVDQRKSKEYKVEVEIS